MKHAKLWILSSAVMVLLIALSLWLPFRMEVEASSDYVSISINSSPVKPQDTYQQPGNRKFFISEWEGKGTYPDSPFLPAFMDQLPKDTPVGLIDLRPDPSIVDGYCLGYIDTDLSISKAGVLKLTDSPFENLDLSETSLLSTRYELQLKQDSTLAEFITDVLTKKNDKTPPSITKGKDGKDRIYIGGLIYGEPEPEFSHTTITDAFTRADASTLGTSSEGWSWTNVVAGWGITSNIARQKLGYGDVVCAYANSDLTSTDVYAQATTQSNGDCGVIMRKAASSTQTYYLFHQPGDGKAYIYKVVTGSFTNLTPSGYSITYGAGRIIKGQENGSSLTIYYNGSSLGSITDSSITTGQYAGMFAYSDASQLDNFEASALTTIAITVSPTSYNFGVVQMSSTSNTTTTYFTIDNTSSVQTDQTISVTTATWAGGVTWTHSDTATAGANQAGLVSQRGGVWGASTVIVKNAAPNYIYENAPATTDYSFGLSLVAPTSVTDGVQKSITVRVSASVG